MGCSVVLAHCMPKEAEGHSTNKTTKPQGLNSKPSKP